MSGFASKLKPSRPNTEVVLCFVTGTGAGAFFEQLWPYWLEELQLLASRLPCIGSP
jgi:hypothetical protein